MRTHHAAWWTTEHRVRTGGYLSVIWAFESGCRPRRAGASASQPARIWGRQTVSPYLSLATTHGTRPKSCREQDPVPISVAGDNSGRSVGAVTQAMCKIDALLLVERPNAVAREFAWLGGSPGAPVTKQVRRNLKAECLERSANNVLCN